MLFATARIALTMMEPFQVEYKFRPRILLGGQVPRLPIELKKLGVQDFKIRVGSKEALGQQDDELTNAKQGASRHVHYPVFEELQSRKKPSCNMVEH